SGTTFSQVISRDANGGPLWEWNNGVSQAAGNMRMVPTISPDGTRLFVGADLGKVFCLDTTLSPPQRLIWQFPAAPLSGPVRPEWNGVRRLSRWLSLLFEPAGWQPTVASKAQRLRVDRSCR